MQVRDTARHAEANAVTWFPKQMLPSQSQLVRHAGQGRSKAGRGQYSYVVSNTNASQPIPVGTTCRARKQQGRPGPTYPGAVHLACFPCVPGWCRLQSRVEQSQAEANAMTCYPTQMLSSQCQLKQHAGQGHSNACRGQRNDVVSNGNAS